MKITVYGGSDFDRSGKNRWHLEELGVRHDDHWLDVEFRKRQGFNSPRLQ